MYPFATPLRQTAGFAVLALLMLAAPLALAQQTRTHNTGVVQMTVFDNGFLGASATQGGGGFVRDGENGLYEGQLIVSLNDTQVCGEAYAGQAGQETPNWVNTGAISSMTSFPAPFEEFDEGYETTFNCSGDASPIPISVRERSYSRTGDPFVVFDFRITNTGGQILSDVAVGLFADFDVSDFVQNLGQVDTGRDVLYNWDTSNPNTQFYGMMGVDPPGGQLRGWSHNVGEGSNPTGAQLDAAMINQGPVAATTPDDRRSVIGMGFYDILPGQSISVRFAFLATDTQGDMLNFTDTVRNRILTGPTANEPGTEGTPTTYSVSEVYPNPFASTSTVRVSVAEPQHIRTSVYDALGREVAVLHDGPLGAGVAHTLTFDASALPSGLYLIRTVGETFTDVRRATVAR